MIPSYTRSANSRIRVSHFSCTHPRYGQSIFAHELAHALSYAFSENLLSTESLEKYKEIRQCSNNRYKINPDRGTKLCYA